MIHGFSGGGYMYADVVATILHNPDDFGELPIFSLTFIGDS